MAGITYTATVTGQEVLSQISNALAISDKTMRPQVLDAAASSVKQELQRNVPVGRSGGGGLRDSIGIVGKGDTRQIGPTGGQGSVGSPLPARYAIPVETGNRPHFPNYSDIALRFGVSDREGFAIARKIAQNAGRAYAPVKNTLQFATNELYRVAVRYIELSTLFR